MIVKGKKLELPQGPVKGETYTFVDRNGHKAKVYITDSEKIGEGNYAQIFHVQCAIYRVKEALKSRGEIVNSIREDDSVQYFLDSTSDRVIKQFFCESDAAQASEKHRSLRKKEFPLFEAYALEIKNKKDSIIMPNGNKDGWIVVSWNKSKTRTFLEKNPVSEIFNFQGLLSDIKKVITTASAFNIFFPTPTYFFHVKKDYQNNAVVRFSLDDVDEVDLLYRGSDISELNSKAAKRALEIFIDFGVSESKKAKYKNLLEEAYKNWLEEIEYVYSKISDC